jgi:hypothetical protein
MSTTRILRGGGGGVSLGNVTVKTYVTNFTGIAVALRTFAVFILTSHIFLSIFQFLFPKNPGERVEDVRFEVFTAVTMKRFSRQ